VPDNKFRDDKYDGGEVGGSQSVTALYELKLWQGRKGKVATTYVRYKQPETNAATEFKSAISTGDIRDSFEDTSRSFKLASAAAQFAEILRKSYWAKDATIDSVLECAQGLTCGYRKSSDVIELVDLISKTRRLINGSDSSDESETEEVYALGNSKVGN
jgi:Ca-activated chloride channel family protein